ncbi:MAG: protein phosphatase 2C domain-containing protein [Bacteroidota bacterium]
MGHQAAAVSVTGQRDHNEDTVLVLQAAHGPAPLSLVAVADGMGGYALGEVASQLACEALEALWPSLQEAMQHQSLYEAGPAFLTDAFALANRHIASHADANLDGEARMGTTLVVALVHGDRALFANLGDSRGYLLSEGYVQQVTEDHSVVADAMRRGIMTEAEAMQSPYRHALTRSLDGTDDETPDLFPRQVRYLELEPGATLCLCSDGLSGVVSDEALEQILVGATDLQQTAEGLVQHALDLGSLDNVSLVLLRLEAAGQHPAGSPKATMPERYRRAAQAARVSTTAPAAEVVETVDPPRKSYWVAIGFVAVALLAVALVMVWLVSYQSQERGMVELLTVPDIVDLSAAEQEPLQWRATGFGDQTAFEMNVIRFDPAANDALLAETSVPLQHADSTITWLRLADEPSSPLRTPGNYAVTVFALVGDETVRSTSHRLEVVDRTPPSP